MINVINNIDSETRTKILAIASETDQRNMALGIIDKDMDKLDEIAELLFEGNRRKDLVLVTLEDNLEELVLNNFNN